MPGLLQELDDTSDSAWQKTVTRPARLPRREWMERIGLPPTRQAVRLFSRIKPWEIGPHLPLIRQAFANPLALKRLSDTTCVTSGEIAARRKAIGLSQKRFAEYLGVGSASIERWETAPMSKTRPATFSCANAATADSTSTSAPQAAAPARFHGQLPHPPTA